MAIVHGVSSDRSRIVKLLTTDFCPWANRFVSWLKEPVGWFVIAVFFSSLVGLYISPIGWTIASALSVLIIAGICWPALAVYGTECRLSPVNQRGTEESTSHLQVSVRNRLPIPVWGLAIEGYLDRQADPDEGVLPTVAFSSAAPLSTSDFMIPVTPQWRGHYPLEPPLVACSFPFGIWTARRKLAAVQPLVVWPRRYPIGSLFETRGALRSDVGTGARSGSTGDFIGVRPYRQGDSAKQIHWTASARLDSLVVTERGGPQNPMIRLFVDTSPGDPRDLRRRIRVAASILELMQHRQVNVQLRIGDREAPLQLKDPKRSQWLDLLAAVPHEGEHCGSPPPPSAAHSVLRVLPGEQSGCLVEYAASGVTYRQQCNQWRWQLDANADLGKQLATIFRELGHVRSVA